MQPENDQTQSFEDLYPAGLLDTKDGRDVFLAILPNFEAGERGSGATLNPNLVDLYGIVFEGDQFKGCILTSAPVDAIDLFLERVLANLDLSPPATWEVLSHLGVAGCQPLGLKRLATQLLQLTALDDTIENVIDQQRDRLLTSGLQTLLDRIDPRRFRIVHERGSVSRADLPHPFLIPESQLNLIISAMDEFPALAKFIAARGFAHLDQARSPAEMVAALINDIRPTKIGGSATPAHARRLRNLPSERLWSYEALSVLTSLPVDWLPTTPDDLPPACALCDIIEIASGITKNPAVRLIGSAPGRWTDYAVRIAKAARVSPHLAINPATGESSYTDLAAATHDIKDMLYAFSRQIAAPVAAHLLAQTGMTVTTSEALKVFGVNRCRPILFGAKGFVRVLEHSAKWHRDRRPMEAAMRATSPHLPGNKPWGAGLPNWSHAETGLVFQVLTSQDDLSNEGAEGPDAIGIPGLDHCVAGYAPACRSGGSRILSIRRNLPQGFERVATIEIAIDRYSSERLVFELKQIRGLGNSAASAEACMAADAYVAALNSGTLPVAEDQLSPSDQSFDETLGSAYLSANAGYDWTDPANISVALHQWAPFLPRPLRLTDPDEFASAVGVVKPNP